jgi:transcriptional regulator GlxA family with amidase domain
MAFRVGPKGPAQAGHFHDEVQIVAVREGWRSYSTSVGTFRAEPGQIVVLPGGLFHAPTMSAHSIVANIYLGMDHAAVRLLAEPVVLDAHGASEVVDVIDRIASVSLYPARAGGVRGDTDWISRVVNTSAPIQNLAEVAGLSIDGFIRSFARQVGTTPAQYRIAHRLNVARALLRQGGSPADAASASGFADQSHLGRCFLRAYGTTPAAYRAGMRL